jgi:small subunit ribosomal protein S11
MARSRPKKARKNVLDAIAHVHASFNNTIITITDRQGNTPVLELLWLDPGVAQEHAVRGAGTGREGRHRGPGTWREGMSGASAGPARDANPQCALNGCGLKITSIEDVTPIPQRLPSSKKRRV